MSKGLQRSSSALPLSPRGFTLIIKASLAFLDKNIADNGRVFWSDLGELYDSMVGSSSELEGLVAALGIKRVVLNLYLYPPALNMYSSYLKRLGVTRIYYIHDQKQVVDWVRSLSFGSDFSVPEVPTLGNGLKKAGSQVVEESHLLAEARKQLANLQIKNLQLDMEKRHLQKRLGIEPVPNGRKALIPTPLGSRLKAQDPVKEVKRQISSLQIKNLQLHMEIKKLAAGSSTVTEV